MRYAIACIVFCLLAVFSAGLQQGCAAKDPVAVSAPNSPQTQALNLTKTLSDSINAAVKAGILLRDQGKLSQANNLVIQNWAKSAVALDENIATELGSADAWSVQKAKILAMLPGLKVPAISGLDPSMQANLTAITALIAQIQGQLQ